MPKFPLLEGLLFVGNMVVEERKSWEEMSLKPPIEETLMNKCNKEFGL